MSAMTSLTFAPIDLFSLEPTKKQKVAITAQAIAAITIIGDTYE